MNVRLCSISEDVALIVESFGAYLGESFTRGSEVRLVRDPESQFPRFSITSGDYFVLTYNSIPALMRGLLFLLSKEEDSCRFPITEESVLSEVGIMIDCSRNAVPKVDTLKKMLFLSACMGYTYVGLYIEDTIEVPGEPYFGHFRGRLKLSEIKEADEYARSIGMELRPFLQTLAHFNQIVRYEEYAAITDTKDILFVGEPRTFELLDHLFAAVNEAFSCKKLNIGMDEAELLGCGKYRDKYGYKSRSEIMEEHLEQVLSLCEKYEFSPTMWSDMFIRMKERGEERFEIPDGLTLCHWDYYSTDIEHYLINLKSHREMTDNLAFAGGAWKWTGFAPHNRYSIKEMGASLKACQKAGITEYVITCWGDNGAECSHFGILPAVYDFANCMYGSTMSQGAFKILTGICFEDFLGLDDVNPHSKDGSTHNNSAKYLLFNDPLLGLFDSVLCTDTIELINSSQKALLDICYIDSEFSYIFDSAAALLSVLSVKADLGKRIRMAYFNKDLQMLKFIGEKDIPDLLSLVEIWQEKFRYQWMKENKVFGFEVQDIRIGALKERLRTTSDRLIKYAAGEITEIMELEEEGLSYGCSSEESIPGLNYNLWTDTVSASVV